MKRLIIIGLLGSLLACTGQPSGSDANSVSAQKYPYRFHCYTSHIYVDAFLNDSLPIRMVYDCAAPFVWLDSTFVDNHYGYESKQTMAFEGIGTDVSLFADVARNLNVGNWISPRNQGLPKGLQVVVQTRFLMRSVL